jgi:hypothetical protein
VLKRRSISTCSRWAFAAAIFLMGASIVQAAEECRPKPGSTAPSGSRWVYRINRADHRHCWFLGSAAGVAHSHLAQTYHVASDSEPAPQERNRDGDLHTAATPADNSDATVAFRPRSIQQPAVPSAEQSPDDLTPRSVRTVVYRLPRIDARAVVQSTAPAPSPRTVAPAAPHKLNVALLAGAAGAGLCFAGGIFHFARRVHRKERLQA